MMVNASESGNAHQTAVTSPKICASAHAAGIRTINCRARERNMLYEPCRPPGNMMEQQMLTLANTRPSGTMVSAARPRRSISGVAFEQRKNLFRQQNEHGGHHDHHHKARDERDFPGAHDARAVLRAVVERNDAHCRVGHAEERHERNGLHTEIYAEDRDRRLREHDQNTVEQQRHHRADGLQHDGREAYAVDIRMTRRFGFRCRRRRRTSFFLLNRITKENAIAMICPPTVAIAAPAMPSRGKPRRPKIGWGRR